MFQDGNNISELNPRPIRIIKTMGDVSVVDWVWFIVISCLSLPVYFIVNPGAWFGVDGPTFQSIVKLVFCLPIIAIAALLAFIQNRQTGKLRTRLFRFFIYTFKGKTLNKMQLKSLYAVREIKENHIHYKTLTTEGVVSCFRIEGFDPSLLESAQVANLIDSLGTFFSVNIRFKILAMRVTYKVPPKDIALDIDHYGVNFAKNRYTERIEDINTNVNLKQQAYFLIIDGPSITKNMETFGIISSPLSDAHLIVHECIEEEVTQILNEMWFDSFNPDLPNISNVKGITADPTHIRVSKADGTHEFVSFMSYNQIPETSSMGWLGQIMNSYDYTTLMDISPMSAHAAAKYMESMDIAADSIMQTSWFKKRASDTERMKIDHLKQIAFEVSQSIVSGDVGMKEVCFYMTFRAPTRKELKKTISEFKNQSSSFNSGWMLFDCKYLQLQALFNTRLHDIPELQYHKSTLNLLKTGSLKHADALATQTSSVNGTGIIAAIDHKILTTSLGLSYPFYSRSSVATEQTWYKGFLLDESSSESAPFFNDYWKANEQYNSFNRFYQGRNGSGKSYTANIDLVADRLDDKFIISIDPKPERVVMTQNLGGANLNIGSDGGSNVNIFDVLVTPNSDSNEHQSPLLQQYQANLTSIAILLSLNVDLPEDKIVLSCFNDTQEYIYEKVHKFTKTTDFTKVAKNKYPLMKEFYYEAIKRSKKTKDPQEKTGYQKLIILMKEHAIGVSAAIFNNYTNIDWSANRMWNLIVRDIALNYGNKNILACWVISVIRVAEAFMLSGQHVVLYIDELHLIHNIPGVLQKLDEFARIDRSFKAALCLINQNFNSIRSDSDPRKKEYYESIFTMSQYNLFFTTGEEDVLFLVDMLAGSGQPLSITERNFVTRAGRGKALLVMTAYDRYRVQFDISFWRELWESDLQQAYIDVMNISPDSPTNAPATDLEIKNENNPVYAPYNQEQKKLHTLYVKAMSSGKKTDMDKFVKADKKAKTHLQLTPIEQSTTPVTPVVEQPVDVITPEPEKVLSKKELKKQAKLDKKAAKLHKSSPIEEPAPIIPETIVEPQDNSSPAPADFIPVPEPEKVLSKKELKKQAKLDKKAAKLAAKEHKKIADIQVPADIPLSEPTPITPSIFSKVIPTLPTDSSPEADVVEEQTPTVEVAPSPSVFSNVVPAPSKIDPATTSIFSHVIPASKTKKSKKPVKTKKSTPVKKHKPISKKPSKKGGKK